jgi:phospholipid/cholesterol/gamma-HCH transport system substrate-binding protein
VGLLAIVAIAMGVFMSLKITSNQSGFGDYTKYRTIITDAAGIFPKTPIKVAGINAGRIHKIELLGHQALITFEVLNSIKITKSSILRIKTIGFLGDKYIDIYVGDQADGRLAENELIPAQMAGGLEDLTKDASEIMADLKAIMGSIKDTLTPSHGESPIKKIVKNLQDITDNIKDVTGSAKRIITDNEQRLANAIRNLDKMMASLAFQLDPNESGSLITDFKKVGPILDNVNSATADLKTILADLKAGKGTVGKLLRDEEVIDQVSETLSGVNKLVNKVNIIRTELSLYSGVNTETDGQTGINLNLFPAPERFYKLGIVTSEFGPEKERLITTTNRSDGGSETVLLRQEKDKNSFKFNVQIGRRIHDFGLRAGLFESSGGVGIDYYLTSWGAKFSFEAFDYSREFGPNLRLLSEIEIWNIFYGRLAFEDLVSKVQQQSMTIGAGLRFTDEDLKGLIGFFF